MLGPQDERTLMLNAQTNNSLIPGRSLNIGTLSRAVRTVNNRTMVDNNIACKIF